MKKKLGITLAAFATLSCAVVLSACGHTHTYSDEWSSDEHDHWHAATCYHDDIDPIEKAAHTFDDGVVIKAATHMEDGELKYTCTVCSYSYTVTIPKQIDAHTFADEWSNNENKHWHAATCGHDLKSEEADHDWEVKVTKQPTHTTAGEETHTCKVCKYSFKVAIPATDTTGHTFVGEWSHNETQHWHAANCGHDLKADEAAHDFEETITTPATHTTEGVKTFTCKTCGYSYTETIPAKADEHTFATEWSKDENKHWHAANCGHDLKADEADHTWNEGVVTKEPTATEAGVRTYTCTVCGATKTESIPATGTGEEHEHTFATDWSHNDTQHWHAATCEHTDEKSDLADHDWSAGVVTKEPTATETGVRTYTCTVCGATKTESIPATGTGEEHEHTFATDWSHNDTQHWHAATCEHTDEKSDLADHDWGTGVVTKEPTATETGVRTYTCTVCGATKTESIPATGTGEEHEHTFATEWSSDADKHWHAATCEHTDEKADVEYHVFDKGVIIKAPTETERGVISYICTVCGVTRIGYIPATGENHKHIYSGVWSYDETGHYHEAICGHDITTAKEDHVYDETAENPNECTVCGYVRPTPVDNATDLIAALQRGEAVKLEANIEASESIGLENVSATLDLNGYTLTVTVKNDTSAIYVDGGSFTLKDSAGDGAIVSSGNGYGIYSLNGGSITVENGSISAQYSALTGNNTTELTNITVKDGTFTAKQGPAIYFPAQGTLTIEGGTFNGGIIARMGQIYISGGEFIAPTSDLDPIVGANVGGGKQGYEFSGNVWLGGALTVLGGTYTAEDETLGNSLNLNITGGKFVNSNGDTIDAQFRNGITIYVCGKEEQQLNVNVSGATFEIANGEEIVFVDPADLVESGYNPDYTAVTNVVKYNGELVVINNKTLTAALNLAKEGDTIAIVADITLDGTVTNGESTTSGVYLNKAGITIDGKGHTLTGAVVINADSVTLKDVTLTGSDDNGLNVYQAKNVTIDSVTIENYKKVGIAINEATVTVVNSTIEFSYKANENKWYYDIGIMYKDGYTASTLTIGEGNIFGNGWIYSEGVADTVKYDEDVWTKTDKENGGWDLKQPKTITVTNYTELETALANVSAGDTIEIADSFNLSGSTNEGNGVRINVAGITINGNGKTLTGAVVILANDVKLENLTLTGSTGNGLNVYKATGVVINNVIISSFKKVGIAVNASEVTISNTTINDADKAWGDIGLMDTGANNVKLENNTYSGVHAVFGTPVIYGENEEDAIDGWNRIYVPAELHTDNTEQWFYFENKVTSFNVDNYDELAYALAVAKANADTAFEIVLNADIELKGKVVNGATTVDGIYFDVANVTINGNNKTLTGAVVISADNVTIENVTLTGSEDNGLNVYGAKNATITGVTIQEYKKVAIAINGSTGVQIENVTTKYFENGWHFDIGFMYAEDDEHKPLAVYTNPSSVTLKGENNVLGNGWIYSERANTADGEDTVEGTIPEGWLQISKTNGGWDLKPMTGVSFDETTSTYSVAEVDGWKSISSAINGGAQVQNIKVTQDLDFTNVTDKVEITNFSGTIDFDNHTVKGLTLDNCNSFFWDYGGLIYNAKDATIKNLKYEIADLGVDKAVRPVMYISGNTTIENVTVNGSVTYSDNNTSVFAYEIEESNTTLTIKNCTNYATINNSGATGIFFGKVMDSVSLNNVKLVFENCVNYGTVYSAGHVAMLISNACTFQNVNVADVTVENCVNYGKLYAGTGKNANLFVGTTWKNGKGITAEQIASFEGAGKVENGTDGDGNTGIAQVFANYKTLAVEDGNYKLEATEGAAYYYLTFSFWAKEIDESGVATNWGTANITLKLTSLDDVNVAALGFILASATNGATTTEITGVDGTKLLKVTVDGADYYVFNISGYNTFNTPTVTFTAYDAAGNVLSIAK